MPAVEVEHGQASTRSPSDREERLADPVGGRPHPPPRGATRRLPLQLSGDHAHPVIRAAIGSETLGAEAAAGGLEQRAELRRLPASRSVQQVEHLAFALPSNSGRSSGRLARRSAAIPALAGAEDLALAAQRPGRPRRARSRRRVALDRPQPGSRQLARLCRRTGGTGELVLAAPDPAAQLVQLARRRSARRPRSPSPSALGTSTPTSITRGRDQHVGLARRRSRASPRAFVGATASARGGPDRKSRRLTRACSRSASTVAAVRLRPSPTRRPAGRPRRPGGPRPAAAAHEVVGASPRSSRGPSRVLDRLARPAGSSRSAGHVEVAVGGQRERVRGIGVAVMCSTWGAWPESRPLASSARRCSTPNRCCSSTTAERRAGRTRPSASNQAHGCPRPVRSSPDWRARLQGGAADSRAGVAPVSKRERIAFARPAARVERRHAQQVLGRPASRWAPSAPPGRPASSGPQQRVARPPAVFPEPGLPPMQQPLHGHRRARGRRRSRPAPSVLRRPVGVERQRRRGPAVDRARSTP